jgi:hypothetical protein
LRKDCKYVIIKEHILTKSSRKIGIFTSFLAVWFSKVKGWNLDYYNNLRVAGVLARAQSSLIWLYFFNSLYLLLSLIATQSRIFWWFWVIAKKIEL